jgi:hypothetical protein
MKIAAFGIIFGIFVAIFVDGAHARDLGQWDAINNAPEVREWYQKLMRPDMPSSSCCGEANAYWCDDIHVKDGKTFCAITDDRPDPPRGRPHVDVGTVIEIPPEKLKWDRQNPTGHSIVFLGYNWYGSNGMQKAVFCFVQSTGI